MKSVIHNGGTMEQVWTHEERLAAAVKLDEIIESQQFAVETIGNHGYMPGILDIQCELVTLRASLAQSEAERERLREWAQEWHKVVEVTLTVRGLSPALSAEEASAALTDDIEARKESWTFADEEQIVSLRADLARERELHQGLRQSQEFWKSGWYVLDKQNQDLLRVVREYRDESYLIGCRDTPVGDSRCSTCIKADALLEDKSKPVATTS